MKYIFLLMTLLPHLAFAQAKVIYSWKEEPQTVMAQSLGEPPRLPECSRELDYGESCITLVTKNEDRNVYQIKNPARLGIPYTAQIYTRRGRVSHVILSTSAANQVTFYRLLVQRYGFPHQQQIYEVAGAQSHRNLVWIGKESKMRFIESLGYTMTPQSTLTWTTKREDFDVKLQSDQPKRPKKPDPVQAPRVITGPGFN